MSEPTDKSAEVAVMESKSDLSPQSIVEALLFSTNEPLSARRIAQTMGIGDAGDVKNHIEALNKQYDDAGSSFCIEAIAKGYQMQTRPGYHSWVSKLQKTKNDAKLTGAALETLAIVAYKQPALRADIEAVRGVAVGDIMVRLRDMNLIRIVGRAEELGRPLLYGTTNRFLEIFGLSSLDDLPKLDPDRPDEVPPLKLAEDKE